MTCEDVDRGDLVEKYVLDELGDDLRDPFEAHYFECRRCFDLLQTYRALQVELAATRAEAQVEAPRFGWVWQWAWAPAAAILLIAAGVWLWQQSQRGAAPAPTMAQTSSVPEGRPPAPPPAIDLLARFEPPPYVAGRFRGAADPATERFQEGMRHYQRGDYRAAVAALGAAARLDPEAPHIGFFLGVSHLLTGDSQAAIDALSRTTALGDSAFLEDAYFYLAKAHLSLRRVEPAIAALRSAAALKGDREAESRQLLGQLESTAK